MCTLPSSSACRTPTFLAKVHPLTSLVFENQQTRVFTVIGCNFGRYRPISAPPLALIAIPQKQQIFFVTLEPMAERRSMPRIFVPKTFEIRHLCVICAKLPDVHYSRQLQISRSDAKLKNRSYNNEFSDDSQRSLQTISMLFDRMGTSWFCLAWM